uniref:DNA cytosine methyltransferase n=1 Tax=Yoonia sp. TaxID=2212373 RepID=UPI004048913C
MLAEPGFHTRAFVEWEDWPRAVLIAAQRAGYFAPAPIWDDLRSFDARPFHGAFDIVLAGYPCQPFSAAGKRGGTDDPRHLWPDVARVIRECRPAWVFLENVPGHVTLGLENVLRELWDMGYTPAAGLFCAAEVGAPHQRLRIFILAHTGGPELERQQPGQRDTGGWQVP